MIQLTKITNNEDVMVKRLEQPVPPPLYSGIADLVTLTDFAEFGPLIDSLKDNEAITLGITTLDKAKIVTKKKKANGAATNDEVICRTLEYFNWPDAGILYFDFDGKYELGNYQDAIKNLLDVVPELSSSAHWIIPSVSATFKPKGGFHMYVHTQGISEDIIKQFRVALRTRLWLTGNAWMEVSKNGSLLERHLIDLAVLSRERLIFSATETKRDMTYIKGTEFDVQSFINRVSKIEIENAEAMKAYSMGEPEVVAKASRVRKAWAKKRVAEEGGTIKEVEKRLASADQGVLLPGHILHFKDSGDIDVVELLNNHDDIDDFLADTLADPVESDYGGSSAKSKAKLFLNRNSLIVNSFAHGSRSWVLKYDAETVEEWLETTKPRYIVEQFQEKLNYLDDNLSPAVYEHLIRQVAKQANITKGVVETALKVEEAAPELDYINEPDGDNKIPEPKWLSRMNKNHAWVINMGSPTIVNFDTYLGQGLRNGISMSSIPDFKEIYRAEKIPVKNKMIPVADIWLNSKRRKKFKGFKFEPLRHGVEDKDKDVLNLWDGWNVGPAKGVCTLFERHIYDIICGGNSLYFEWLMDWFANIVQTPAEKPGTALVLQGKQGTGKDTLVNMFSRLLGNNFLLISSSQRVTARFNAMLANCLVLHANEATFGGDKRDAGTLKGMITESHILVEPKGKEPFTIANHIRAILSSNTNWIVATDSDDRRMFVLKVLEKYAQDPAYFKPLYKEIEQGAYEAMFYDLLHRKIQSDLRNAPVTKALQDQILLGLSDIDNFLFGLITDGELLPNIEMEKDSLYSMYITWTEETNARHKVSKAVFFRSLPFEFSERRIGGKGKQTRHIMMPGKEGLQKAFHKLDLNL